jgi:hypothetical protein
MVTQVYAVLGNGWFFQMIQPDVLAELLNPDLDGIPIMSNVNFTTFRGHAINASCFQAKFIPDRPKETGDLPGQEAYSTDVMSH